MFKKIRSQTSMLLKLPRDQRTEDTGSGDQRTEDTGSGDFLLAKAIYHALLYSAIGGQKTRRKWAKQGHNVKITEQNWRGLSEGVGGSLPEAVDCSEGKAEGMGWVWISRYPSGKEKVTQCSDFRVKHFS